MILRTLRALGLTLAVGLVLASPSWADATAQLSIEDGGVTLTDRPDAQAIVNSWRTQLGVDSVRIQAFWDQISREGWGRLDRGIALIRNAGLQPILTIHEKGPQFPARPSPAAFAAFAGAAAARYRNSVYYYTIGNEPNQGTFLTPQRIGGRPYSPHLYRAMVNAAYPAIKRADPSSLLMIGVMAPIGGTSGGANSVAPLQFLREFACLDRALHPMRTGFCAGFRPARGDAFAYHPYSIRYRLPPFARNTIPDLVNTGDLDKLFRVLNAATRQHRIIAPGGRFNVYFTEYGYETRPPDPRFGFPPDVQSRFLQQAAYIAWKTPRVKMMNQYLYFDDPDFFQHGSNVTFQTGIMFHNGTPKPARASFPHPFYVDVRRPLSRARARIWGQVRPGGATTVTVQYSPSCSAYSNIATVRTNFRGYFAIIRAVRPGCYRFVGGGQVSDPQRL
ncbi:MAG: hypothetical protein ACJ76S_13945 [Solirubrobacteraceae bacterium]